MKELRFSVSYPMPLRIDFDQQVRTYAEHYGFSFLGSGSDGYTRDLGFLGTLEMLQHPNISHLFTLLLSEGFIITLDSAESRPSGSAGVP